MSIHCGHAHPLPHAHDSTGHYHKAFALSVALNISFVFLELLAGWWAGSIALLADALHNFGDVLSLLVAWLGYRLSFTKPSTKFTYGLGRFSIYAALFNGVTLIASAVWIFVEASQRFGDPLLPSPWVVGVVAGVGIVINSLSALLLARGQTDLNRKAAVLHLAGDAAVSAGVVGAALIMGATGWAWVDPLFGVLVAAIIFISGIPVLRDGVLLAMDGVPKGLRQAEIYDFLKNHKDLKAVYDLHIWGLSTTKTALTAHLEAKDGLVPDTLQRDIHRALQKNFGLTHVTLQLETDHSACIDQHEERAEEEIE